MEWPFISQRAEIELTLLMGIVSIDLHVSALRSEGPPQTQLERDEGTTALRKTQVTLPPFI